MAVQVKSLPPAVTAARGGEHSHLPPQPSEASEVSTSSPGQHGQCGQKREPRTAFPYYACCPHYGQLALPWFLRPWIYRVHVLLVTSRDATPEGRRTSLEAAPAYRAPKGGLLASTPRAGLSIGTDPRRAGAGKRGQGSYTVSYRPHGPRRGPVPSCITETLGAQRSRNPGSRNRDGPAP